MVDFVMNTPNESLLKKVKVADIWEVLCEGEPEQMTERVPLSAYGVMPEDLARLDCQVGDPPPVVRSTLIRQFRDVLEDQGCVVFYGAGRSGKSTLLNALRSADWARARYKRFVILDFYSLRAPSRAVLDRGAFWSVYIDDDDMGTRLLAHPDAAEGDSFFGSSFIRYLESGEVDRGLLVLDHTERLPSNRETTEWLTDVIASARARGTHVVMICRGFVEDSLPHQKVYKKITKLFAPNLGHAEVESWLANPFFDCHRENGLTADRVIRITGGRPGLVKDFGLFLASRTSGDSLGLSALIEFAKHQSKAFSVECGLMIDALRASPQYVTAPLTVSDESIRLRLLSTGGVKLREPDGKLSFASPIFGRRYRELIAPDRLLSMLVNSNVAQALNRRKYPELARVALNAVLMSEYNPRDVFARFVQVLSSWDATEIRIYLRDPQNARLWSLYYAPSDRHGAESGTWPLVASERPGFARAVYSGRRVSDDAGKVYLPLVGTQGRVEMIASFHWEPGLTKNVYAARLLLRSLWNTTMALERAMALAIERVAYRRQFHIQRAMYHRITKVGDMLGRVGLQSALREAQCSSVAVLERGREEWVVTTTFEGMEVKMTMPNISGEFAGKSLDENANGSGISIAAYLSESDTLRLDEISDHPKQNGLVLRGRELANVFPRLEHADACFPDGSGRCDSTAIFLRPVRLREGKSPCRIVAFIFQGNASREVNGSRQSKLSVVAAEAVAV